MKKRELAVVRGGGDIATGTIHKLYRSGFSVLVLETEHPSAIRRHVAFSEAVYDGHSEIEGVTCILAENIAEAWKIIEADQVAMLVDPRGDAIKESGAVTVVDAILAKRNLGTFRTMAPLTIALGPGFLAGTDVDVVIETMRGHTLGRLIYQGAAIPNTGVPGMIAGVSRERVIHAEAAGIITGRKKIGDWVGRGEVIACIGGENGSFDVTAAIDGILRGLIRDGYPVVKGFKIADIDPRETEYENCFRISDKARCIAGGVLEAVLHFQTGRS